MKVEMEDMDDSTICDSVVSIQYIISFIIIITFIFLQNSLVEGCRLPVHMTGTIDWRKYFS